MLSPAARCFLLCAPLWLLGGEALWHAVQVIGGRINYPYELEWMEGAILQQVLQLRAGAPLYGEPTLAFVPALYMPLYYAVSSLAVGLLGEGLPALRVVSVLAIVLVHALLFVIARRAAGSVLAGALALLLFAWSYPYNAFWFDLARLDSLWTLGLVAAIAALQHWRARPSPQRLAVLVGCVLLAFLTKQATLFLLPFLALALGCWGGARVMIRFSVACTLAGAVALLLLQQSTGGYFWYYTFEMASTHGVTAAGFRRFFLDMLLSMPVLLLLAMLMPGLLRAGWRERAGWWLLLAGFFCLSMLSRAYAGAFFNVLLPLHAAVALLAALALVALAERASVSPAALPVALLAIALVSANLWHGRYDPRQQWPTEASRAAHAALVERLAAAAGPVCVTAHGYLGWMAGKGFCAHHTQVSDMVTGRDATMAARLREDARRRILAGEYAVIVLDRDKELQDLGLALHEIPYQASAVDFPRGAAAFAVNGYSPTLWLERKP